MALFAKKEGAAKQEKSSLLDMVLYMKKQGYADDQLVDYLQNQGYKSSQIFDAISQAEMKAEEKMPISGPPSIPEFAPSPAEKPSAPEAMPSISEPQKPAQRERVEELAEAIIEEKWSALTKSVDKIAAWKDRTEERILKLEEMIKNIKDQFDKLHSGVLGQVSEYSKGLSGVSSDVKALSEVFKKTLPTFTQNLAELQRITKKLKGPKKK